MEVDILNLGGIITRLTAPDRAGNFRDVVLGFDSLRPYLDPHPFFGALVGRFANRIGGASFELDGETYQLPANDRGNHLHGGANGFDKALWEVTKATGEAGARLVLRHRSPDGQAGYPGNLEVTVTYTLTPDNALDIQYEATTDQTTILNMTQHSYFNLSGDFSQTVRDHLVQIDADSFLPTREDQVPTGEFARVAGTPFDFREPRPIGKEIDGSHPQLEIAGGYDHCYVLNQAAAGFRQVAEVHHPGSGRVLQVGTDEPGVQFYTSNFKESDLELKGGHPFLPRGGFCLETQHFPDSPNKTQFPSTRLEPGETYRSRTRFTFTIR